MADAKPRLLLVDDDRDFRTLTSLHLRSDGHEVSTAVSGEEALFAAANRGPDLVLLDFKMGGIDGVQTLKELRKRFGADELPILMLSSHQDPNIIREALDSGANDYISKSVSLEELSKRVQQHLKGQAIESKTEPALGDYKIERSLRRERHSTTFLLEHPTSKERVLARLTKPGFALDQIALESFVRVDHPQIGELISWSEEPVAHLLADFKEGKPLSECAGEDGLGIFPSLSLLSQLTKLLQSIESVGMVHGDICPQKVLIDQDEKPLISELGLDRAIRQENEVAASDCWLGSVAYQSPERVLRKPLDIRSDLYSLGALAFFLFTGKAPFEGENCRAVATKVVEQEAPLVSAVRSDGLSRFDGLVSRLLSKEPADRFQSSAELMNGIESLGVSV